MPRGCPSIPMSCRGGCTTFLPSRRRRRQGADGQESWRRGRETIWPASRATLLEKQPSPAGQMPRLLQRLVSRPAPNLRQRRRRTTSPHSLQHRGAPLNRRAQGPQSRTASPSGAGRSSISRPGVRRAGHRHRPTGRMSRQRRRPKAHPSIIMCPAKPPASSRERRPRPACVTGLEKPTDCPNGP